jgi:ATP phosphoribosyltransferase
LNGLLETDVFAGVTSPLIVNLTTLKMRPEAIGWFVAWVRATLAG